MIFPQNPADEAAESYSYLLQRLLSAAGEPVLAEDQAASLGVHLDLLMRWNEKVNLTAIRDAEGILKRHFMESIFCARLLPARLKTMLDYGSGGGFPGIPCAICRPDLQVTLAESQAKKATFLREAVRVLGLRTAVYHGRIEEMGKDMVFDAVVLRAVDRMSEACRVALRRVRVGGMMVVFATVSTLPALLEGLAGIGWETPRAIPDSHQQVLAIGCRAV